MRTIVYPAVAAAFVALSGCSAESISGQGPESEPEPEPDPVQVEPASLAEFDKVDLLLVVDNSISMAEKQEILGASVERLLNALVNPPCVEAGGVFVEQPATPEASCPAGSFRRSAPVRDLHVGVISSSLGDLGAGSCAGAEDGDERGHLRWGRVPTYQDLGFLAWDPDGELSPAGESSFETLVASTVEMVAVGEFGCGYEMPLEAMTRFLVDPNPYDSLVLGEGGVEQTGTDPMLLAQRAAFLRPDSIVGVVLLSDENDCSLDPSQGRFVLGTSPFFKPTAACEADPNDACCTSCALPTPVGCSADPSCEGQPKYTAATDQPNLKCFDQKRRYGIDFHYPMGRYVNALSSEFIDPAAPNYDPTEGTVQNPLFAGDRQPGHVVFTAITGVPWQDLATDSSDPASPLKSSAQMEADGSWGWLTGQNGSAPLDPFMRESVEVRSGNSPATGESTTSANGINGGDFLSPENDNLQFSCIFPLQTPLQGGTIDCDCVEGVCDSPLCDGEVQIAGKAYPGLRQLELAHSLGNQSIVGSICPPAITELPSGESSALAGRSYAQPLEEMAARLGALLPDAE